MGIGLIVVKCIFDSFAALRGELTHRLTNPDEKYDSG
jgi:hypothetical protein